MGAVGDHAKSGGSSGALTQALPLLRCPVCGSEFPGQRPPASDRAEAESGSPAAGAGRTLCCAAGHAFDVAKQGYVTLLGGKGRTIPGDSAPQVIRRERFLEAGHFAPIADALAQVVATHAEPGGAVFDSGAGTGYYLRRVLDQCADSVMGIGSEISVPAAKRLAKAHPRAAAVIADTRERFPVADGSFDVVTVVFAPRNANEFHRVLRPGGVLVVVWPGPEHLLPLRDQLGLLGIEGDKQQRMFRDLEDGFDTDGAEIRTVRQPMQLAREAAVDVAMMGPSGFHVDEVELVDRVAALPQVEALLDVRIGVFRKR